MAKIEMSLVDEVIDDLTSYRMSSVGIGNVTITVDDFYKKVGEVNEQLSQDDRLNLESEISRLTYLIDKIESRRVTGVVLKTSFRMQTDEILGLTISIALLEALQSINDKLIIKI